MELNLDQITAKSPHKVLPNIEGEPDYQSIHDLWTLLYVNEYTLSTTQG